jgi:hypothetical protein
MRLLVGLKIQVKTGCKPWEDLCCQDSCVCEDIQTIYVSFKVRNVSWKIIQSIYKLYYVVASLKSLV